MRPLTVELLDARDRIVDCRAQVAAAESLVVKRELERRLELLLEDEAEIVADMLFQAAEIRAAEQRARDAVGADDWRQVEGAARLIER
jgi:hypothetical protein